MSCQGCFHEAKAEKLGWRLRKKQEERLLEPPPPATGPPRGGTAEAASSHWMMSANMHPCGIWRIWSSFQVSRTGMGGTEV